MTLRTPPKRHFRYDTLSLRWQVIGEIEPPVRSHPTRREESALNSIGNILRRHPCLSVEQCEELYRRVENDLSLKQTIIMELAEQDARLMELSRQIEAGLYHVEGGKVAERMLAYPAHRDYERRLAYYRKREELRQEAGMSAALPPDPAGDGEGNYADDWPERFDWNDFFLGGAYLVGGALMLLGLDWLVRKYWGI